MVSVEKHNCFCKGWSSRAIRVQEGRGYLKCSKESCTLFVPEEKYLDLMDAYENKVLEKYKPLNFPKCNELASVWLSYPISDDMSRH